MSDAPEVFTLLAHVGRAADDGLPEGAAGGALLCYAAGRDEAEAVRETVAILKEAGLAVLEVEGHGSRADREAAGHEIAGEERTLMDRALAENAVIVADLTAVYEDDA